MAGGRESSFKHHKYKGMHNSSLPDNIINENDPEELTISQIKNKYHHLRRVADGESKPIIRQHPQDEIFPDVYLEFVNFFSRGQLQHLEKLFLMADQDRDGQLNPFELKYWMEQQRNPISEREVKQIFKVADKNKDGYLNFREFLLFCQFIELKNIPSENQDIRVQGLVKDPTGQSNKYPPRYDDGVGKIASKLKSFTRVRGNIGGALEFFENEISKETESAQRNRKTYDAVIESKRRYSRPSKSIPRTKQSLKDQRYRTSLNIQLQQPEDQEDSYLQQITSIDPSDRRESMRSISSKIANRRTMSQDRGSETPRNYRASLHFEPEPSQNYHSFDPTPFQNQLGQSDSKRNSNKHDSTTPGGEETTIQVNPHVSPNAYNISLPFINQPKSGSNHPALTGENRPTTECYRQRNSVPINSSINEKYETNNRRNTFPQSEQEEMPISVSSKSDTQVVYVADPNLRTPSGPDVDKAEQNVQPTISRPGVENENNHSSEAQAEEKPKRHWWNLF